MIIHDIKWYQSQKEKHSQLSLIYKILCKIIQEYSSIFINNINIHVAIYIEFTIFLYSKEFTWDIWNTNSLLYILSWWYIIFNFNNSITLFLSSFKINSFRKNIHIQLTIIISILYLIYILKLLFQQYFIILNQSLFTYIMNLFSKSYFIIQIHELLLQTRISTHGFSDHSIHKNVIIFISTWDIFKNDIKLMNH